MAAAHFGWQRPSFPAFPHQEAVTALAQSQNNFTRDLYAQLARGTTGNLFFSPFSMMAALSMTYTGTAGTTREEMRSAMHLTQDDQGLNLAFQDLITDIKKESSEYELRTSNMAYVSDKLKVLDEFATTLREKYMSSSKTVDFDDGEGVRQEINSMVEKETNSRIKDLIPAGVLNSLTRMVLVNAVYFKGLWEHQFLEASTYEQDFWTSEKESIKVPMMHIEKNFRMFHRKDLGAMVLAMDYKGSRLSMVFVLPDEREGLAGVEAKMAEMNFRDIDQRLHSVKVEVTIPKFKLEESLDLISHLEQLGIKNLFDERCDLSGITGTRELFVSNVLHKAFLEVNEKGSEAAAATAVVMSFGCALPQPTEIFRADHPFVFFIRDRFTGTIMFSGRLMKPKCHQQ